MTQLHGAWPTMVTPFDENLKIDSGTYRAIIQWYLTHKIGGLYANCLSSEMYHLSNAERLQLAREAVRAANGRVPVVATGNLGSTTAEHIDLCQRMAGEGVAAVMLVVPEFLNEESELEDYFMSIAGQVDVPLGLYECPVPRPFHLSPELTWISFLRSSLMALTLFSHLDESSSVRSLDISITLMILPFLSLMG